MKRVECFTVLFVLFLAQSAFALDWADYYPTGQGSSWTYRKYGSNGGVSYDEITASFIEGFEDVTYGGTVYSGFKYFDDSVHYAVLRISGAGLEHLKYGKPGEYSLFGSAIGSSPVAPWLEFPRSFNLGETIEVSYKEYSYYNSGVLREISDHNLSLSFAALEDVTVPAGTFANSLKIFSEESGGVDGDITYSESGTSYFAPGVGYVKESYHSIDLGGETVGNDELLSYNVTPEPISSALFLLGAGALAGVRKLRKNLGIKKEGI